MAREDTLTMTQKELKRLHVLHKVLDRRLAQTEAADLLGRCTRQVRRMIKRLKEEGDKGIVHKSCSQPSHNAIDKKMKEKILALYQSRYPDFGPTLACEKLLSVHQIQISDETLRRLLIEKGIPYNSRKKRPHRQWRERSACSGQMVQMDGSHHDWFEGRAAPCVLMAYIDDATGNAFARFYPYEGTMPAMDSFKRYIQRYGLPLSLYLDKHSTYKSTAKPSLEDELNGTEPLSEFERAAKELGVSLIHAHSPQAKGRVERLFKTFQDRLVKEMRLKKIKTLEGANAFLETYLPLYNQRFALPPRNKENLHRSPGIRLDKILCLKTERALRNDFTVAHKGKLYQIESPLRAKRVVVEERLDGSLYITHQGTPVQFKEIRTRPQRVDSPTPNLKKRSWATSADNPWRRFRIRPPIDNNGHTEQEKEPLLAHA